ncbi:hypothetical protein ALC56_06516 [Trachymyrmex septentrionalis]|uniref:Uncharacterized protein n=1 Tax=Trachymyrmex septentrionalis TaxID=34720 RepID=A0A195FEI3_9HYME|nr:hypothetical protein ALC56_06516 [Trachymyrmex septentrionalis]
MINITPQSYGIQTDLETDFFFLLKASLSGVVVQLPSRNFSSTQNRKPEREIKSREEHRPCLDHAEESRCEVSLALYPLTLPEGAGMESIIVPVIALLAWAVIRNRRD